MRMSVFSSGEWKVKAGREDGFVRAWNDFAESSRKGIEPDVWALLLRDKKDPRHFRSIARWREEEAIARWQGSEDFRRRTAELREMVEQSDISVFDIVVSVGSVPEPLMSVGQRD
ncbi:MAG TPA: antibiotic biosynthesis monooxygenase family protein [Coriobacteriia bacterium]|jgi:heme-degrading monooxygenase HmoA